MSVPANAGSYSPDSDAGYVRLLISDTGPLEFVFADVEIAAFLAREGGPLRAAAQALDTIADNEALTSKAIRTQDLQTDGPKVADSLRKRAAALRQRAAETGEGETDTTGFEVVYPHTTMGGPELARFQAYGPGWLV